MTPVRCNQVGSGASSAQVRHVGGLLAAVALVLTVLLAPGAADAEAPPFPAPPLEPGLGRYPVAARLVVPESVRAVQHRFEPWEGGPSGPAATVEVGGLALDVWRHLVLGHFLATPDGAEPALDVRLTGVRPSVLQAGGLWQAQVQVSVEVWDGARRLETISRDGRAAIGGRDGAEAAFKRAARAAAVEWARAFDASGPVRGWLVARGVAHPVDPERPERLLFLDLGLGYLASGGAISVPAEVQAGVSTQRFFARGVGSWRRFDVDVASPRIWTASADLTSLRLGLDAGVLKRLGYTWELQLGVGAHALQGVATSSDPALAITKRSLGGSVMVGVRSIGLRRFGANRLRLGLEGRLGLGTGLQYTALDMTVDPVTSLLLTVGLEPWASAPGPATP